MIEINQAIKLLPFYNSLNDEYKKKFIATSSVKKYKKDQEILDSEGKCDKPFLVLSGSVSGLIKDEGERQIILFELYTKEMGILSATHLFDSISFNLRFVANEETYLLMMNPLLLGNLMEENIEIKCQIYEILADRFSYSMSTIYDLFFMRYEKRLANFLLDKYALINRKVFRITQKEIACLTNSVREVTGRTIRKFKNEGILEYQRGKIRLLDIDKLRKISGY